MAGKPKASPKRPTVAAQRVPGIRDADATPMFALAEDMVIVPGCGFGISQSIVIGAIDVKLPSVFNLEAAEQFLENFTLSPLEDIPPITECGPEGRLVGRMHLWHTAMQRGANVPVFGNCRLWDGGMQPNGARRIRFAVPCYNRRATMAALRFVCEAIAAFTVAGRDAKQVLASLQGSFTSTWQMLTPYALTGSNSLHFIHAAADLDIAQRPLVGRAWLFGHGVHRMIFNSSVSSDEPHLGVSFARNKLMTTGFLRTAGLPSANGTGAIDADIAAKLAREIGYPVVVKPVNMDGGVGVTAGIEDEADLRRAFATALEHSDQVMVEKHQDGQDYRVTVLQGKAIKVMVRRPGGVTGDGHRTVAQLLEADNEATKAKLNRLRKKRPKLTIDEEAQFLLAARGYTADTTVPAGEFVPLRRRSNISAGGTHAVLPVDQLHPDNRMLAINAANALGLDIAGVDIISGDPTKSWRETGGIVCEVNASPQIGAVGSEDIFRVILTNKLGGTGMIPIHLLVLQDGVEPPAPIPTLAAAIGCNAAAWDRSGWIDGAGELGPFANTLRAGLGILFDKRTTGALIAMTESDVLRDGLPAHRFASIRLLGKPDWQPPKVLGQLVEPHSQRVLRENLPAA